MSLSGRLDGQLQTPIGRTLRSKTLGIHGYRRIAPSKAALFETSGTTWLPSASPLVAHSATGDFAVAKRTHFVVLFDRLLRHLDPRVCR